MGERKQILVVEDEPDLAQLLAYNLQRAGYDCRTCDNGRAAVDEATRNPPHLVVLDLMLPGLPGLEIARRLRTDPRTSTVPILMLTAKGQEEDQLAGLNAGADDYVVKPFSIKVLLARVETLLRRSAPAAESEVIRVGNLSVDLNLHAVAIDGSPVSITLTEFRILVSLMRSHGRAMTRDDLMYAAIGPDVMVTARTIDVHIAAIRKKLGPTAPQIRTIRGVGYLLDVSADGAATVSETGRTD